MNNGILVFNEHINDVDWERMKEQMRDKSNEGKLMMLRYVGKVKYFPPITSAVEVVIVNCGSCKQFGVTKTTCIHCGVPIE